MYIIFLIVILSTILLWIQKIKDKKSKTASDKKTLNLEIRELKKDKIVLSNEIEKIKCKEIIKK